MIEKVSGTWPIVTYGSCLCFLVHWCCFGVSLLFACFVCVFVFVCCLFFLNQWELYLEVQLHGKLMFLCSHFKGKQQGEEVCMG